jgi:tetratricopeptide (TPR) repeat protein
VQTDIMREMIPVQPDAADLGAPDQVHPARLLYGFFKARKTGILVFNDGSNDVRLYFLSGCPVSYETDLFAQPEFAQYLVRFGLIAKNEFQNYRRRAAQEKLGVIDYMLRQAVLDRAMVRRLADHFYERNIIGLFSWRRGNYAFYERGQLPGFEGRPDPVRTLRWIVDGIRQKYHSGMIESRLEKRLDTPLKEFKESPIPLSELLIADDERQIGQWIAEGQTLAWILDHSRLGAGDARALVFALLTIECAKFEGKGKPKAERPAAAAGPRDPWERLFHQAESSVERIHREVERETVREREFERRVNEPVPDAEPAEVTDDAREMLRRKLQDKIRQLQKEAEHLERQLPEAQRRPAPADRPTEFVARPKAAAPAPKPAAEPGATDLAEMLAAVAEKVEASPAEPDQEATAGGPPADDIKWQELPPLDDAAAGGAATAPPADEAGVIPTDLFQEKAYFDFSDSDSPEQVYKLGVMLLEQEEWERAHRALNAAIERGHAPVEAKVNKAWAYYNAHAMDREHFSRAAEMLQEQIEANPRHPQPYLMLGRVYLAEGDRSMAELYFVKALELDRNCQEAKEFIRKIYVER